MSLTLQFPRFLGEQLSPEFLHSHHTVPTFKDDKIILSESRAILAYLVNLSKENIVLRTINFSKI